MKAEIITIGDELLIGQVIDTNSAWIGQRLTEVGIQLYQRTACGDSREQILDSLHDAALRADIIILTGGLGPTNDDITKATLCKYFNTTLIENKIVKDWVCKIFSNKNLPMLESNLLQAMVPLNCEILFNRTGTAPGMWFNENNKIFISLPGVPFEMKTIFDEEVLPRIKQKFSLPSIFNRTINTVSIGESFLADKIKYIEDELPSHIKLAYLPSVNMVRLRLSAFGENKSLLEKEVNVFAEKIYFEIAEYIYGEGNDSLANSVGKLLMQNNKTVATAESCSGGYIAHQLTSVSGSSKFYLGSIIAYSYAIKESELGVSKNVLNTLGAVSEECVVQMAEGIFKKFNVDYAISASGIAGPDGGTNEKPVGTVWIAIATKEKTITKKSNFGENREYNIQKTSIVALDMLRKILLEL